VVTDSSAAALMARGQVDLVMVGADRIARNGDVANKIGTYSLAVVAERHRVPLYVVAPLSTLDPDTATGAEIPIEERDPSEVTADGPALNLAFDVTPHHLVTAVVTEAGLLEPPYEESILRALRAQSPA
jgi:methylthioribose-1-phosphate isomerase